MLKQAGTAWVVVVCALCVVFMVGAASGVEIHWQLASGSGFWDVIGNWDAQPPRAPGAADDAKHVNPALLSSIRVRNAESCLSFEGKEGVVDRFLRVDSSRSLTIGTGGLAKAGGIGTGDHFSLRVENGVAPVKTQVSVQGPVQGIAISGTKAQKGERVSLRFGAVVQNSQITLSNSVDMGHVVPAVPITFDSTSLSLGDDAHVEYYISGCSVIGPGDHSVAWQVGNRAFLRVPGDIGGVDFTAGTSAATGPCTEGACIRFDSVGAVSPIRDTWLLRGYADLTVDGDFTAADKTVPITIRDHASLSAPNVTEGAWVVRDSGRATLGDVSGGTWTVSESALVSSEFVSEASGTILDSGAFSAHDIVGGTWSVSGAGSLNVTDSHLVGFNGDSLTMDGGTATGDSFLFSQDHVGGELIMRNKAYVRSVLPEPELDGTVELPGFNKYATDSLLQFGPGENVIEAEFVGIGGRLVRENDYDAFLSIICSGIFFPSTRAVRVANGETIITPFDAEAVSVRLEGKAGLSTLVEASGPDYYSLTATTGHEVMFVDSPCLRRWGKLTFTAADQPYQIIDDACTTPISGRAESVYCRADDDPSGDRVPEALYAIDLEVQVGAMVVAGDIQKERSVAIFTTNPPVIEGTIVDLEGNPVTPGHLDARLYGDFNGVGGGDEPDEPWSDTYRFNKSFCTCIGDTAYDPFVDWNCDGRIDDQDRVQYNRNWNNPSALTTAPCSADPCP